ncbi:hypothetical protein BKA57DRAFT_509535 [Linnemannia elongata]|nr:hypothetical protein BKA57DRAFT_509535 [Linnemannia elongata]
MKHIILVYLAMVAFTATGIPVPDTSKHVKPEEMTVSDNSQFVRRDSCGSPGGILAAPLKLLGLSHGLGPKSLEVGEGSTTDPVSAVKLLPINRDGGYFLNDYEECTDSKRSEDHKWKRLRGFIRAQALELHAVAAMSDSLPASRRLVSAGTSQSLSALQDNPTYYDSGSVVFN